MKWERFDVVKNVAYDLVCSVLTCTLSIFFAKLWIINKNCPSLAFATNE